MAMLYSALCLGAVTAIYPFMLMVSTALKGPTDQEDGRLVPQYTRESGLADKDWSKPSGTLLGKVLDDKYAANLSVIQSTRIGADASPETIQRYNDFLMALPLHQWAAGYRLAAGQVTSKLTMEYQLWLSRRFRTIEELNAAYVEENVAFNTVPPPSELLDRPEWKMPDTPKMRDWQEFKKTLPADQRIPIRTTRLWQEFVQSKCQGQFSRVPAEIAGTAKSFESLTLPNSGAWLEEFSRVRVPDRLKDGGAEAAWNRLGLGPMPIDAAERQWVRENAPEIRREFATRNFRYVIDYVLLNGRAVVNTMIYCGLVILIQLTVNPLAAYALSRYPMPATARILIFLLATMAFPAEVAMIPSFLLLKGLGLLNTFAALVLPTAASGYLIYLLKGFFDSLPQELFESAQIDGAPETTMLMRIALPLSRPVLGYLALLAFMGAYGAFIFAFLIAQDRKMWTLMVSMYQLQLVAPKAVVMAGLTLTAIPTLAVFLAAQRVIMRGIVLPGER